MPEPVTVLDNVMVTSGDPLHYIRFEFGKDRIDFSGVYSGAAIREIRLFRPSDVHRNFTADGSSFSGSIDISGLKPNYYIIIARLDNNEGMYYVFQKTPDGSRRCLRTNCRQHATWHSRNPRWSFPPTECSTRSP